MSTFSGGFAEPGTGTLEATTEVEPLWASHLQNVIYQGGNYSDTIRDTGQTPTTDIRAGMLLGALTADNKLTEWDPAATDGSQFLEGMLPVSIRSISLSGTAAPRVTNRIVRAQIKADWVLILGVALQTSIWEFTARRALSKAGWILDDDVFGRLAGMGDIVQDVTGTTHTPTEAENGQKFMYSNAAAVIVTLPAIKAGLSYDFVRTANEALTVNSAEGDNVIVGNDLSADGVVFTTAVEHIGAWVKATAIYTGAVLKWHYQLPQIPFGTTGAGLTFAITT